MDQEQPRILANKVILQLIEHSISDQLMPSWDDFSAMRVAFRQAGGSWGALSDGDPMHLAMLQKIVSAWGSMPARQVEMTRVI